MRAIVGFSGGIDSTVLVAYLLSNGYQVKCQSFTYGSKHNKLEEAAAKTIYRHYEVPWRTMDLGPVFSGMESALLDEPTKIPEGHYESPEMSQTIVPGRNIIFAAILSAVAQSEGYDNIALGIHSGDHAIYPDCRAGFKNSMNDAIFEGTGQAVEFIAPFLLLQKRDIVKLGLHLKVPFDLTRTCYTNNPLACGKCGACVERLEAFADNGVRDPIKYEGGCNV